MKKKQVMPKEVLNAILEKFEGRAQAQLYPAKGKKRTQAQLEFVVGAIAAIDTVLGNDKINFTCVPPIVWVNALRGDYIKPIN